MVVTLVILALSAVFFVSGKIRSDVVALCALVLLLLFHILTPDEALSGFSNSVVIMMIGLFVVGGAIPNRVGEDDKRKDIAVGRKERDKTFYFGHAGYFGYRSFCE